MKHFLAFLFTLWLVAGISVPAQAQKKNKDQEYRHVVITLKSGEKTEGYLHRGWHADNALFKKENYSFKVVKTPDDKEPVKYTAEEVESIDYVEKSESDPDGIRWEAHDIASPGLKDRYRTFHRLVCLYKASRNATVYWWKTWTTERVGNQDRRVLKTIYGIRFHNDPDKTVYPYILVTTMLVEKHNPGLQKFCKGWFKGAEGKEHKKASKNDDAWMLDMYDAYLVSCSAK